MQESQPALNIITNRPVKYVFMCRIFVCIFGWAQLRTKDMLGLTSFISLVDKLSACLLIYGSATHP
jgi:hypothetical protein